MEFFCFVSFYLLLRYKKTYCYKKVLSVSEICGVPGFLTELFLRDSRDQSLYMSTESVD